MIARARSNGCGADGVAPAVAGLRRPAHARGGCVEAPAGRRAWPWLSMAVAAVLCGDVVAAAFDEVLADGDTGRLLEWGKRYFYGVMAPQDMDRAIQLYCAAARQGSGEAQYRLGEIYARTLTRQRDEILAAAWFLRAVASDYAAASKPLARWDLTGVDIPAQPPCVLSADMVSRSLPAAGQSGGGAAQAAAAVTPEARPASDPADHPASGPGLADVITRPEIERLVRGMAPQFDLSPELVLAVIQVESNFDPKAQSPKRAQGLMQLIPATAQRFGVHDPWDPRQNLRGGMAYLHWLLRRFDGDVRLALAGYNAGEGAVQRHGGVPPYAETQGYLRKVSRVLGIPEVELSRYRARPNTFVTEPREADSRRDWEQRFFDVDLSG